MNKTVSDIKPNWKKLKDNRIRDVLLLAVLAIILIVAAWKIFGSNEEQETLSYSTATEAERKISRLLTEIDGVGEASVMICESEDGVKSVVVVCEGANDLQVIMNVREAVSAALGTEEKEIKIYRKKN